MDFQEMNNLVKEIRQMNQHMTKVKKQPLLIKKLRNQINRFKNDYEEYLSSKLVNTYKNYFPFDQPDTIEKYFTEEGALVERDQKGNPGLKVSIHSHPIRIVLNDCRKNMEWVAWQVIC